MQASLELNSMATCDHKVEVWKPNFWTNQLLSEHLICPKIYDNISHKGSKPVFFRISFWTNFDPPPLLATYVSLVGLLSFSVPQFPHLLNRLTGIINLSNLCKSFGEITSINHIS